MIPLLAANKARTGVEPVNSPLHQSERRAFGTPLEHSRWGPARWLGASSGRRPSAATGSESPGSGNPPGRRKGGGVEDSVHKQLLQAFVAKHSIECFSCASHGPLAKTGINKRGPWVICVPCVARRPSEKNESEELKRKRERRELIAENEELHRRQRVSPPGQVRHPFPRDGQRRSTSFTAPPSIWGNFR